MLLVVLSKFNERIGYTVMIMMMRMMMMCALPRQKQYSEELIHNTLNMVHLTI